MTALPAHDIATVSASDEARQAIEVSVVIPCLNEENGVGICVEKALRALESMGAVGEVIVVDNGSTDRSAAVAAAAGARVVHERRRGYGAAYLRGFAEARGRYLVMGDADDTYDFLEVPRFIEPLRAGACDMIMGNRFGGMMKPGAMPWTHRYIGNPILSSMLRVMFDTTIRDSHSGMRAFTREAYERLHLRTTGMELASELVVNALRAKLRIQEIDIPYRERIGESKLNSMSDAWRHIRFLLMYSPSYLFRLPGLVLAVLGALVMAYLSTGPQTLGDRTWDYHGLMFGALALILGYNLLLFDVLAKAFSVGVGLIEPDRQLKALLSFFSIEKGLVIGAVLFLCGVAVELDVVLGWLESGGGSLMAVRRIMIGMSAIVLGAQTAFGSFLVGLMLIKHR
jgi:glycosyltransferase involved in cell wall biosynthesis